MSGSNISSLWCFAIQQLVFLDSETWETYWWKRMLLSLYESMGGGGYWRRDLPGACISPAIGHAHSEGHVPRDNWKIFTIHGAPRRSILLLSVVRL